MQGTGNRFPAIAVTAATAGGSPAATPSGMAPRSSTTGTMAIKKVMASFPNTLSPKIMYVPSRADFRRAFFILCPFLMNPAMPPPKKPTAPPERRPHRPAPRSARKVLFLRLT